MRRSHRRDLLTKHHLVLQQRLLPLLLWRREECSGRRHLHTAVARRRSGRQRRGVRGGRAPPLGGTLVARVDAARRRQRPCSKPTLAAPQTSRNATNPAATAAERRRYGRREQASGCGTSQTQPTRLFTVTMQRVSQRSAPITTCQPSLTGTLAGLGENVGTEVPPLRTAVLHPSGGFLTTGRGGRTC